MVTKSFSERLNEVMKDKHIKQIDIIRAAEEKGIKLGKSHISQYVNGKSVPRDNILSFLAEFFNVDKLWLSGENDINTNNETDKKDKKMIEFSK